LIRDKKEIEVTLASDLLPQRSYLASKNKDDGNSPLLWIFIKVPHHLQWFHFGTPGEVTYGGGETLVKRLNENIAFICQKTPFFRLISNWKGPNTLEAGNEYPGIAKGFIIDDTVIWSS